MTDTPGDGATLYESKVQTREPSISSGVDVARAEAEFNELARQLSNTSAKAANDRSSSHGSTVNNSDLEKSNEKDEERFDLREYLRSSNDANQAAGIKHKVGLIVIRYLSAAHPLMFPPARRRHLGRS